jgi:hypothetical protein
MGLYEDHIMTSSADADDEAKKPHSTGTNVDHTHRQQDFGAHFDMADKSPAPKAAPKPDENQAKVIKGLDASWSLFDESPEVKKENLYAIKTGGDGMGGRIGKRREWGGYEDEDAETKKTNVNANGGFWDF